MIVYQSDMLVATTNDDEQLDSEKGNVVAKSQSTWDCKTVCLRNSS